jgi:hypothetical protein
MAVFNNLLVYFRPSRLRFRDSTFTRGSPRKPIWRPSVACATAFMRISSDTPRALATRATWSMADSGVMWGSRPLADASTRSAGMAPVTPVSRSVFTLSFYGLDKVGVGGTRVGTARAHGIVAEISGRRGTRPEIFWVGKGLADQGRTEFLAAFCRL